MPVIEKIIKYTGLLKKLFPVGKAWENILDDNLFSGMSVEFARIEDRSIDLLREMDPLTSSEMLKDWESLLGLPDECTPEDQSLSERQSQCRQKLSNQGGQSAAYLEDVSDDLGFEGTVFSDYVPFEVGRAVVGAPLTNNFDISFRVGDTVGEVIRNSGWRFVFQVNALATINDPFEVGNDTVGDPLVVFGNPLLQCTIKRLKPAHTQAFFTYRDTL